MKPIPPVGDLIGKQSEAHAEQKNEISQAEGHDPFKERPSQF